MLVNTGPGDPDKGSIPACFLLYFILFPIGCATMVLAVKVDVLNLVLKSANLADILVTHPVTMEFAPKHPVKKRFVTLFCKIILFEIIS